MNKTSLLIGLLAVIFISCDSKDETNEIVFNSNPVSEPSIDRSSTSNPSGTLATIVKRKIQLAKDFSNLEEFKSNINRYDIEFSAVAGHFAETFVECKKEGFDSSRDSVSSVFDVKGLSAKVELELAEDGASEVTYECLVTDGEAIYDRASVRLKKSFVISGKKNFFEHVGSSNIETLLFEEGSELSTNGSIVEINVNELISDNGKLVTFSEDRLNSTRDNATGKSGGHIMLKANSAVGYLDIELRGQNGGKVTKVPPPITDAPKQDPKTNGCHTINDSRNCSGKQGAQGFRGTTGRQGSRGGDSGAIELTVNDSSLFSFSIKYLPGLGSEGGIGGQGGPGAPGGIGGENRYQEHQMTPYKVSYPNGPQGPQGPQGDKGLDGNPGANEESQINLDNQKNIITINSDFVI